MTFAELLNEYNEPGKKLVRKIESTEKKIVNAQLAVAFNKQCIKNNILPKFTHIHLDEAVQQRRFTLEFRKKLVLNQIEEKTKTILDLQQKLAADQLAFEDLDAPEDLKCRTVKDLADQLSHHQNVVESRAQKKLCNLYGGWLPLAKPTDGYLNLSKASLTDDQKGLLNLGVNFTFSPRFSSQAKKAELELLYQDICKLEAEKKIIVNPDIQEQLQAEGTKNRSRLHKPALAPRLHRAARQLRENTDIVIRKADKAQVFVLLDSSEYYAKAAEILSDESKFMPVARNPVEQLKRTPTI